MLQTRRKYQVHALLLIFVNTADPHLSAAPCARAALCARARSLTQLLVAVHTHSLADLALGSRLCLLPVALAFASALCLVITRYLIHAALRAPASIQIYYPKRRLAGKIPVSHLSYYSCMHRIEKH